MDTEAAVAAASKEFSPGPCQKLLLFAGVALPPCQRISTSLPCRRRRVGCRPHLAACCHGEALPVNAVTRCLAEVLRLWCAACRSIRSAPPPSLAKPPSCQPVLLFAVTPSRRGEDSVKSCSAPLQSLPSPCQDLRCCVGAGYPPARALSLPLGATSLLPCKTPPLLSRGRERSLAAGDTRRGSFVAAWPKCCRSTLLLFTASKRWEENLHWKESRPSTEPLPRCVAVKLAVLLPHRNGFGPKRALEYRAVAGEKHRREGEDLLVEKQP